MPRLGIQLGISNLVHQTARLARDLWNSVKDTWQNEQREWQKIV